MGAPVRVLHWNVFEDGLADVPSSIGFSRDFRAAFDALLQVLSDDGAGRRLLGLPRTRIFTAVPEAVPVRDTAAFFGFLDDLYNVLYHGVGGEVYFRTEPGGGPQLRNALRTLFLRTRLTDPLQPPSAANPWVAPHFEAELAAALATCGEGDDRADFEAKVRAAAAAVFDPARGTLTWSRPLYMGMMKGTVPLDVKWHRDMGVFLAQPGGCAARDAFFRVLPALADAECAGLSALIEVELDPAAERPTIQRLRTPTLQSGVLWLLRRLCEHSAGNPAAAAAIAAFAGCEAPAGASQRAAVLYGKVSAAADRWLEVSTLAVRHARYCERLERDAPEIATLVEYDAQWRAMPLPPPLRHYVALPGGKGNASILFDSRSWELVEDSEGLPSGRCVGGPTPPKSNAVALLRRRGGGELLLVLAVHNESGPPAVTRKLMWRRLQLAAAIAEVSERAAALRSAGCRCGILVGGDFNAVREEFIHGNSDAFYNSPGVMALKPFPSRPASDDAVAGPPDPAVAFMAEDGVLRLYCPGVDAGFLTEVSCAPLTRSGCNMCIDYIFCGSVGGGCSAVPRPICAPEELAQAADPVGGVTFSVSQFGSDHLPVACELRLSAAA